MRRRELIGGLAALMGCSLVSIGPSSARASNSAKKLIFVILRGGMDGLAAVAPVGDPAYEVARRGMALDPSRLLPLSGPFALHPAFESIHEWYASGTLSFVHATGLAYKKRSHFDAQDVLENGSARPGHLHSGWLNRALRDRPNAQGLSVGHRIPLVLRGTESVSAVDLLRTKDTRAGLLDYVEDLWEHDPHLSTALHQGLVGRARVREAQGDVDVRKYPKKNRIRESLSILGRLLSEESSPQVAVLEFGGWDSMRIKVGLQVVLPQNLSNFQMDWQPLKRIGRWLEGYGCGDMQRVWANGLIERYKRTDHGSGGLMMLAGGCIRGGHVHGDWPGLHPAALHQGRDLRTTTDVRSIFKAILHDHMEVSSRTLSAHVFPDSASVHPLRGLL